MRVIALQLQTVPALDDEEKAKLLSDDPGLKEKVLHDVSKFLPPTATLPFRAQ